MSNRGGKQNNLVVITCGNKSSPPLIRQSDLEELIGRRRGLMEMEETMAVALSKGARVEPGVHTAELVPERRPRTGRDLVLKLVIMVIFLTAIPTVIFCQEQAPAPDHEGKNGESFSAGAFEFTFSGSVALRRNVDSMTDEKFCKVTIESDLVSVDVAGTGAAVIQTPSDIDYNQPALLRIDDGPPIPLSIQRQKIRIILHGAGTRQILVPASATPDFVRALYTRRRVRLRYSVFPGPGRFDGEIKFGDFAAAYDRGVELCAWPKLRATAVHPTEDDLADLMFPGTAPAAQPPAEADSDPLAFYLSAATRHINMTLPAGDAAVSCPLKSANCGAVAFAIEKDGSVGTLPAGNSAADRACIAAVRAANPLPPLPVSRPQTLAVRAQMLRHLRHPFEARLSAPSTKFSLTKWQISLFAVSDVWACA